MADTTITDVEVGAQDAQVEQEVQALSFPVYMIYSRWSLKRMDRFMDDYGGAGFIRIIFGKDDKETDRSIAIMPKETYTALCEDGYGGDRKEDSSRGRHFRATPFRLNESSFPGEGRSRTLFVPVPKVLGEDDEWVVETIKEKFRNLEEWDILRPDSWSVNAPLKSREKGGVRGGCFITFKREVELERIAMARIILTDTYWPVYDEEEDRSVFRCYWARDRKEREPVVKSQAKGTGKEAKTAAEVKKEEKRRRVQWVVKDAKPAVKKAPTVPVSPQPELQ